MIAVYIVIILIVLFGLVISWARYYHSPKNRKECQNIFERIYERIFDRSVKGGNMIIASKGIRVYLTEEVPPGEWDKVIAELRKTEEVKALVALGWDIDEYQGCQVIMARQGQE